MTKLMVLTAALITTTTGLMAQIKYKKVESDLSDYIGTWKIEWCNGADDRNVAGTNKPEPQILVITSAKKRGDKVTEILIKKNDEKILQTENAEEATRTTSEEKRTSWKSQKFPQESSEIIRRAPKIIISSNDELKQRVGGTFQDNGKTDENGKVLTERLEQSMFRLSLDLSDDRKTLHFQSERLFSYADTEIETAKTFDGPAIINTRSSHCHFLKQTP